MRNSYGNLCERLIAPPGEFSIRRSADVSTSDGIDVSHGAPFDEVHNLPEEVLTYLLPSRYCESDRFTDLGRELVDGVEPGYDQVARIVGWIRASVRFNPDSSNFQMSAVEVNQRREGVCRELTHLGIALSRSVCIPARIVVGYLHELEPMDFHAWFEAYVGGRWYTFDATQAVPRGGRSCGRLWARCGRTWRCSTSLARRYIPEKWTYGSRCSTLARGAIENPPQGVSKNGTH